MYNVIDLSFNSQIFNTVCKEDNLSTKDTMRPLLRFYCTNKYALPRYLRCGYGQQISTCT